MRLPGVTEAYSVAGSYDLVAIARVKRHEELANLVAGQLQSINGITSTNTLIAFRAYSQRDLAAMWEIGFEEPAESGGLLQDFRLRPPHRSDWRGAQHSSEVVIPEMVTLRAGFTAFSFPS